MVSCWGFTFIHLKCRTKTLEVLRGLENLLLQILLDMLTSFLFGVSSGHIETLLQEADKYLQKSENCESQKDFVSALSYCTEAASECYRGIS